MFNLTHFISTYVTHRSVSMFAADIEANKNSIESAVNGKRVCVIGGAGSIGSSFIKAVLHFEPASVVVVDLNENGVGGVVLDALGNSSLGDGLTDLACRFLVAAGTLEALFNAGRAD